MDWWKLFRRKTQTWVKLSACERSLFLQSYILLPLINICLRLWGLRQTQTALAKLCPQPDSAKTVQWSEVRTIAQMVKLAVKYSPPWANCLRKSLALWYLLRRFGIESELRIGVWRNDGKFEAHAWIEYQGIVLNDTQDVRQRYTMFTQPIGGKIKLSGHEGLS